MERSIWLSILHSSRILSWTFLQTPVVPPTPADIPFHEWVEVKMCLHICENILAYFNNSSIWGLCCVCVMWLYFSIPLCINHMECLNKNPRSHMISFAFVCTDDFHCFVGQLCRSRADNFSVWVYLINRWFRVLCFGSWIYCIQYRGIVCVLMCLKYNGFDVNLTFLFLCLRISHSISFSFLS